MFLLLMLVNLVAAVATTAIVIILFRGPISGILGRIVSEPMAAAWRRYLSFAFLVIGISSGVSLWTLERYVEGPAGPAAVPPAATLAAFPAPITTEAWVFEVYRTVLGSLRGLSGALLLFFGAALVVSGIQRGLGERGGASDDVLRRGQDRTRGRRPPSMSSDRPADQRRPLGTGASSSGRRGEMGSREGEGRGREGEGRGREGEGRGRESEGRRDLRSADRGDARRNLRPVDSRGNEERGRESPQDGDLVRSGTLERRPLPPR